MPAGQSAGLYNMRGEDEGDGVWEAESGARPACGRRHHHSPPREDAGGAQWVQTAAQEAELKEAANTVVHLALCNVAVAMASAAASDTTEQSDETGMWQRTWR